jgi:acetolactate synthase-1/2/3 large subunit
VWIELPFDVQGHKIDLDKVDRFKEPVKISSDLKIDEVLDLLKSSKRPVIIGGNGVKLSGAKDDFKALVEKLKIPTLLTWLGIDLLEETNTYNFGRPGLYGQRRSNFVIQNSDLVISLGCRMSLPFTGYNMRNFAPKAKIVMVNNDENELQKHKDRYDVKINCDVKDFIGELIKRADSTNISEWYDKCVEYRTKYPVIEPHHLEDDKQFDNSYVTVDKISDFIPDDCVVVFEQGTPLASGHQAFKVKPKQIVICSNGLGEMGNGLPSAIGAAFTKEKKKVFCLMSDGSMMMNLQELQTIVSYKLPIKLIMFNNDGYLFIKHTQKMMFEGRYTGVNPDTGVYLPNFKKVVEAFGIKYFTDKELSLREFIQMKDEGVSMFETFMNPEQELSPKVKGIVNGDTILAPPIEEMSPLLSLEEVEKSMVIDVNPISYQIKR